MKTPRRMLFPLFLFFGGLCLAAPGKKAQLVDHVATLVDLRESINLFFNSPVFDEQLEKTDENPCREIYLKYKNQSQKEVETEMRELMVNFPYYIRIVAYDKATVLSFHLNYMLRGHEISHSFDICFSYNNSNLLSHVGRGGGVMAPVDNRGEPKVGK